MDRVRDGVGTPSGILPAFAPLLFDLHPFPMWIYDRESLAFLRVNEAAKRTYGYSAEEFLGMSLLDIRPAADHGKLRAYLAGLQDGGSWGFQSSGRWRHVTRIGEIVEIEAAHSPAFTLGEHRAVLSVIMDVTDKRRALHALAESRAALADAQELAGITSWTIALRDDTLGFSGDTLAIARALLLDPIPASDTAAREAVERALTAGDPFDVEHRVEVGDGVRWCRTRSKVIVDRTGTPSKLIGTVLDITRDKAAQERLHELAFSDATTALPNRRALIERIGDGAAGSALMLIGFRQLTLAARHHEGMNASISRAAVRELSAALPGDAALAQYSDDTFAIYGLLGGARSADVHATAQRILKRFDRPLALPDGNEVVVAVSIGFARSRDEAIGAAGLIARAGAALGKALERPGSIVRYSTELEAELERRDIIERNLRYAVADRRLTTMYQPIVRLATGAITGVEALLRWDCPGLGMVPPPEFIAVAEASALIVQLGEWVLREACEQHRRWREAGLTPLRVAVNFSWKQIERRDVVRIVRAVCDETGVPPSELAIELTETSLLRRERVGLQNLAALRKLGVRIALDDFGTGFSSLSYLGALPLDILKIDRSFVSSLGSDSFNAKVAAAVAELARFRGLELVGEGVETPEQFAVLRDLGCDEAQGYLLGRPMTADAVTTLLAQARA